MNFPIVLCLALMITFASFGVGMLVNIVTNDNRLITMFAGLLAALFFMVFTAVVLLPLILPPV